MKGKLGSLWVGRNQVGGFLNWKLDLVLADFNRQSEATYKLAKWKLTADSYWLFDIPRKVLVRLYPDNGKGYWEGMGVVTSQTKQLFDVLIPDSIEIIGEDVLEGKE
uniref:Uncharacterized protein n=1 Tax=viral metagenome TaxID=1070528 RepID=A0A6H1ZT57_9ZZZZ